MEITVFLRAKHSVYTVSILQYDGEHPPNCISLQFTDGGDALDLENALIAAFEQVKGIKVVEELDIDKEF